MISKQLLAVAMLAIGTQAVQFEKPTASLLAQQTDTPTTTLNDTTTATTVETTDDAPPHFEYVEADWNKDQEPNLEAGIDDVDLEHRRCGYCPRWHPKDCCFRNIGCIDTNWDQEVMRNTCPPRGFCAYPGKFRCRHCKSYYPPSHRTCGCRAQSEESEYADDYKFAEVDEDGYPVENCYAEDCGCEGDY